MMVLETYENRNVFEIYNLQFLKPIIAYIVAELLLRFSIHKYSFNISVIIRMAYWNIMILDIDVNIHIYPLSYLRCLQILLPDSIMLIFGLNMIIVTLTILSCHYGSLYESRYRIDMMMRKILLEMNRQLKILPVNILEC